MRRLIAIIKLTTVAAISHAAFDANVFIPRSSMEHGWDVGVRAHTNHVIYVGPEYFPAHENPVLIAELMNPSHSRSRRRSVLPPPWIPSDRFPIRVRRSRLGERRDRDVSTPSTSQLRSNDFNTFSAMFLIADRGLIHDVTLAGNSVLQIVYANGSQPASPMVVGLRRWRSTSSGRTRWPQAPRSCSLRLQLPISSTSSTPSTLLPGYPA